MRLPSPLNRVFEWLEPAGARLPFEPPPGDPRIDLRVAAALVPVAVFTALVFAAPFMIAPGSTGNLSGAVGAIDNEPTWSTFPEPARFIYHAGDAACHQKATRSVEMNGNQMPFCMRDVGIFVGACVGLVLALPARSRAYRWIVLVPWWTYLALLIPIAIDGVAQDFFGVESDNVRRAVTGVLAGLAVAFALAFIAYESHFAGRKARAAKAQAQSKATGVGSDSTGSSGSNAVESTPTVKKNKFAP